MLWLACLLKYEGIVVLKREVIEHFGSVGAVASALGIKSSAVSQWPELIPMRRAYEIERITNGVLKVGQELAKQVAA